MPESPLEGKRIEVTRFCGESSQEIPSQEQQSVDELQCKGEAGDDTLLEKKRRESRSWRLQTASETVRKKTEMERT